MKSDLELQSIITSALASDKAIRMNGLGITTLAVECGADKSYFQSEPDDPEFAIFWLTLKTLEDANVITPASTRKNDYDVLLRYKQIKSV
jgi:hypothetical protein